MSHDDSLGFLYSYDNDYGLRNHQRVTVTRRSSQVGFYLFLLYCTTSNIY